MLSLSLPLYITYTHYTRERGRERGREREMLSERTLTRNTTRQLPLLDSAQRHIHTPTHRTNTGSDLLSLMTNGQTGLELACSRPVREHARHETKARREAVGVYQANATGNQSVNNTHTQRHTPQHTHTHSKRSNKDRQ